MMAVHRSRSSVLDYLTTIALLFFFALAGSSLGAQRFLVVNHNGNTIRAFSSTGADLGNFAATGMNNPYGIAADGAGNIYVANYIGNTIHKFSPTGVDLGIFASLGVAGFAGLAFDSAGNLYVSDGGNYTIHKFGPAGANLGTFGPSLGGQPYGLAFDSSGNLYVVLLQTKSIQKLSPTGADLGSFATGLTTPVGLAIDSSDNLYVSDVDSNVIHKFGSTGTDLGTFANTGLSGPWGLAFDDGGNLYVANYSNTRVRKFGPTGTDLGDFATAGMNGPTYIAITGHEDPKADLSVVKLASPTVTWPNSNVTYTITVANAGPNTATNVVVNDRVPHWSQYLSCEATFGFPPANSKISRVGNNLTVQFPAIAPSDVKTITVRTRVVSSMFNGGVLTNTVTVSSATLDPDLSDNTDTTTVGVQAAPRITTGNSKVFPVGHTTFVLRAVGWPTPAWTLQGMPAPSLTGAGALPSGLSFVDNGDGTATISGTRAPGGPARYYSVRVMASNGIAPIARQGITLLVFGSAPSEK